MEFKTENIEIGVVGIGLMGCSICTCLLIAGHKVKAIAPMPADMQTALPRITSQLQEAKKQKLFKKTVDQLLRNLSISQDFSILKYSKIVIECTIEDINVKKSIFSKIEKRVNSDTIITSNTSAIPISDLQKFVEFPARFLGLHWTSPAYTTRFIEVICGNDSDPAYAQYLYDLSYLWGKEPTLVKKDIRGFITNRLMYTMYREACSLVENGYASIEDVDRACRNNPGIWMTMVGVFRWMDLTGVPAYHAVMKDLLPTLNNQKTIPKLIDDVVKKGGKGTANAQGFYDYTPEEAKLWEETYEEFSFEIMKLAQKYPSDIVKKKLKKDHVSN